MGEAGEGKPEAKTTERRRQHELGCQEEEGMMANEFEEMGKRAYHKGINAAAMDPTYRTATIGRKVGDKRNVPELKSWNKGWTIENLKTNKL